MLKKPPSRNQRTKGIRVKHILQIALLIGVCFWLIYQLKHSYDKKAALGENDPKTSVRTQTENELLKLGRKGIPHKDVTTQLIREEEDEVEALREEEEKHEVEDEKNEAEERDEEDQKHEVEETDEEGQTHEAEEQEEEGNKDEDPEDVEKGAGEEEIDENDLETKEGGGDPNEKLEDEEKEREGEGDDNDSDRNVEEIENQEDNENSSDEDNEGNDEKSHEAREEHYKADDASSAVTHETQVTSTETEKINSESTNGTSETSEDDDGNQHNMRLVKHGETSENDTSSVHASEEILEVNSSDPVVTSLVDANGEAQSRNLPEVENNSSFVSSEASENLVAVNQVTSAHQPNETETISETAQSQNATVDGAAPRVGSAEQNVVVGQTNNTILVEDQLNSTLTVPTGDTEFIQTHVSGNKLVLDDTAKLEEKSTPSITKETMDATENEELKNEESKNKDVSKNEESKNGDASKNEESNTEDAKKNEESVNEGDRKNEVSVKEDATMNEDSNQNTSKTEKKEDTSESSKADEDSDSTNTTDDTMQHDPIDSSDSHVSEAEKEARTDLDTLPEIQTVGDENGEAAAE